MQANSTFSVDASARSRIAASYRPTLRVGEERLRQFVVDVGTTAAGRALGNVCGFGHETAAAFTLDDLQQSGVVGKWPEVA